MGNCVRRRRHLFQSLSRVKKSGVVAKLAFGTFLLCPVLRCTLKIPCDSKNHFLPLNRSRVFFRPVREVQRLLPSCSQKAVPGTASECYHFCINRILLAEPRQRARVRKCEVTRDPEQFQICRTLQRCVLLQIAAPQVLLSISVPSRRDAACFLLSNFFSSPLTCSSSQPPSSARPPPRSGSEWR